VNARTPDPARSLIALLDDAAGTWGVRPFLLHEDRQLTFRQVQEDAARVAQLLADQGVKNGDRVLVARSNPVTAIVEMFGAFRAGAVCTIADPAAPRRAAENVLVDLSPFIVLADEQSSYATSSSAAEPAPESRSPADAALIIYTSGSTGRPKGIVASHRNVSFTAAAIQQRLALRPDDRVACLLPLTFDYGLYQVFLALVSGCCVIFGAPGELGAALLLFLVREKITVLPSVPTLSRMVLALAQRSGAALPPVRMVTNTGEAMSQALLRRIQAALPEADVFPMFGLTECKRVSILLPSEIDDRPGSVGRPLTGTRCEIVDDGGDPLGPNEIGQLTVSGPHVTLGYWKDDDLTDRIFRPAADGTRTLFTGDKAWMDEQGYLYFVGRDDDIFKRKGYRVSAAEIAFAAEQIDGVRDAVCLPPGSNPRRDLVLVVTGTAPADRIRAELADSLYPYQLPDRLEIVDDIPLTRHGKTDVHALAALLGPEQTGHMRQREVLPFADHGHAEVVRETR
jgi:acyl-coenzyme A synthetase/AMP-(fatty) acid ligase